MASDQSKKLYLYVVDTQKLRLESVKEGSYGWNSVDIRDRCFSGDFYVRMCSTRLTPQTKLFALHSKKGYIDFYLNLSGEKIMSTKNYESVSSQEPKASKVQNLSLHTAIEIGTEAIYTTLPDGDSFIYPLERDLVQPFCMTKNKPAQSIAIAMLNEKHINKHVEIFRDVSICNGVAIFIHSSVMSVYHLGLRCWQHRAKGRTLAHTNKSSSLQIHQTHDRCLFKECPTEILKAKIVNVNSNFVFDVYLQSKGGDLSKIIMYAIGINNSCQPHYLEQPIEKPDFKQPFKIEGWHVQSCYPYYRH